LSDLVPSGSENPDTSSVLQKTFLAITEGLTGVAASDRKDIIVSFGHIFQKLRGRKFLHDLQEEWERYREKGKVSDDYIQSEQHQECLQEILDFLDQDAPDERRFDALKRIFLFAACENKSTRESVLPQQYMQIVRGLSAGAVLVLFATYNVARSEEYKARPNPDRSASVWAERISKESGLEFPELVENHEETLIQKRLLTDRVHSDRSGVTLSPRFRLTGLGWEICQYIDERAAAK